MYFIKYKTLSKYITLTKAVCHEKWIKFFIMLAVIFYCNIDLYSDAENALESQLYSWIKRLEGNAWLIQQIRSIIPHNNLI